jgi:hypothetical protein
MAGGEDGFAITSSSVPEQPSPSVTTSTTITVQARLALPIMNSETVRNARLLPRSDGSYREDVGQDIAHTFAPSPRLAGRNGTLPAS